MRPLVNLATPAGWCAPPLQTACSASATGLHAIDMCMTRVGRITPFSTGTDITDITSRKPLQAIAVWTSAFFDVIADLEARSKKTGNREQGLGK